MMPITDELHSAEQLVKGISGKANPFFDKNHFFCFRGQQDAQWGLIPGMFRGKNMPPPEKMVQVERDVYRDFQDRARPYASHRLNMNNPWEVLCFAQHYGVPTRLMDWTVNPLVGLFFALFDPTGQYDETDAALWCANVTLTLDPKTRTNRSYMRGLRLSELPTNIGFFDERQNSSRPSANNTLKSSFQIVQAPDISDRIRNQAGLFSVYIPGDRDDIDQEFDHVNHFDQVRIRNQKSGREDRVLLKFKIPRERKSRLQNELTRLGITPDQIFPDLEGIGMFLKYWRVQAMHES